MSTNSAHLIEDVLLQNALISESQHKAITDEKIKTGKSSEEIILSNGLVEESALQKIKADIIGIPYVEPIELVIKPEAIQLIQEATARKYRLIPFDKDATTISVAMTDPEDLLIIQYIERSTNLTVKPFLAASKSIEAAIDREYSKSLGKDVTHAIEQATATTTKKLQESLKNIEGAEDIIKVSPVAQIVSVILEYAVKSGASDIHIEPFETGTRIRYRIDGVLQEKFPLPKTIHNSIVARIKILADMPIDERRVPLDGKFKVAFGESKTDLRVSTIPTVFGEKVVIRLLKDTKTIFTLKQLGMWGKAHHDYNEALKQTTGIIFVTGPTGSGKTVTQATSLSKLNTVSVNIITLEDPVEIGIPGVNQIQINVKAGLTFASGLRSILRQDPNIIMVGEVRDKETAQLAIQAALTGHLVLATLHTNSAAGSIPRLKDMGVESFLIASTLNIALAQRLSRRICPFCKESYEADPEKIEDIKKHLPPHLLSLGLGKNPFADEGETTSDDPENSAISERIQTEAPLKDASKITLYRGKGCDRCNNTGYKGRIGLYEVMKVTPEIQHMTETDTPEDQIQAKAIEQGMITLTQDGYLKAMWGVTTLEEVLSVINS